MIRQAQACLQSRLPWVQAGIVKMRKGPSAQDKRGRLLFGENPDRKVLERGVWYALDLCMHQDASLYLDTRLLRGWLVFTFTTCNFQHATTLRPAPA